MRTPAIVFVFVTLLPHAAGGQAPNASADALYADAKAKEKAVRTALSDPAASSSVLKAVRTVVADYEALVRRYPASAYGDDALWFAGWLSIEAFERFGDDGERVAGARLWSVLVDQYPSSKLAKQVPLQLAKLGSMRVTGSRGLAPANERVVTPADSRLTTTGKTPRAATVVARSPRSSLATLKDIRRTVLPDSVRVTIELDREVPFRDERLADPARVFVDLPSTHPSHEFIDRTIRFDSDADLVRQIRIGRHPNSTTRVVLDVAGISGYTVYPLYGPYRLVIDCVRETPVSVAPPLPWAPRLPRLLPARTVAELFSRGLPVPAAGIPPSETPGLPPLPARPVPPLVASEEGLPPPSASSRVAPTTAPSTPPAKNVGGGFSIARQLGLGVSRIVIDPGHGGHDPGATGKGVTEAAIVLDVALRLEQLLAAVPGVEVILTRRTDDFIGLQDRTAIANREVADLFLSIHANASANRQAHGVETYFLNFATTTTAAAVAARENASSGQPMAALPDFVKTIALHNKLDESRDFATYVQRAMVERLSGANRGLKDLGVKQAPFVVLIGASMPSVLAEISFVTNAQEVKLLRGTAYRQRIADALFNAIRKYQGALKTETKVTQD